MRCSFLLLALSLASPISLAAPPVISEARIDASGQRYQGNAAVNQAAGVDQQQVNARAIAAGDVSGNAQVQVRQSRDALSAGSSAVDATASIGGASFSQGSGVLGVNQGAGVANQQINAFRMTLNALPESLNDDALAQSAAPAMNSGPAALPAGERRVEVDDAAFSGSSGVVQLNQSAGVGNRSTNSVSIRLLDLP